MTTLQLDSKNNLMFNYNFLLLNKEKAIIQDIKNLLLMFKKEYPFNLEMGINWYEVASFNNKSFLTNVISERILEDVRIKAINEIAVDFEGGKLNIRLVLDTSEGVLNV
ncbi:hypothetical protein [Campylobacter sp.]|uniref:hypothetical protein n=1 Tax=Campylobacter sp. TaxID=205 RepID=UPI0025C6E5C8|nr:hypothetical protein [Campylobacter sp.]